MSEDKLDLRPGGIEVLSTGVNLAELDLHGGEGLWDEVLRFVRESQMEAQVDAAMSGRSAPRVWAVVESPGCGPAAAAASLAIARVLADRGQSVVLVDGDEQEPRITRWLGRVEQEGWIDMVRFGASLHAASDPLPSDNRRGSVLGVGSFAPTGVTPDEVADLLSRLRRQADDLVLVLPAKLRSQPWFEAAHIKLLCWDLLTRSAGDTEKIVVELDRMGARPDALLGFGVEEFTAIQDRLREDETSDGLAPLPPEHPRETVTEVPVVESPEPGLDPTTESVPVVDEATEAGAHGQEDEPSPPGPAPEEPTEPLLSAEPMMTPPDPVEPSGKGGKKRRSSGIFIFAAVLAVACLVMLGIFLVRQRGGAVAGGDQPAVATARMEAPDERQAAMAGGTADEETGTTEPAGAEPGAAEAAGADAGEAGRETAAAGPTTPEQTAPEPEPEPEPTPPAPEPAADEAATGGDRELDMTPYQLPVGQDGWALWLYSLPELGLAEAEIRELDRRGIRAEYRTVDIEDKGRWYRVYVGSFSTRAQANAAADELKAELKHDWVVPARF